jgi:hypothetical protein
MWDEIFQILLSNGVWAVLFVSLLVYQLKDSAKREEKYQKTIELLTEKYDVLEEIKTDIDDIKVSLKNKKETKTKASKDK